MAQSESKPNKSMKKSCKYSLYAMEFKPQIHKKENIILNSYLLAQGRTKLCFILPPRLRKKLFPT